MGAACRLKFRSTWNVSSAQTSIISPSSYAISSHNTRWFFARQSRRLRVGSRGAGGLRDRMSAGREPLSVTGGAGVSASPVPALGAGTCASPTRTPLPCGSDRVRAVTLCTTSAAGGGIAAGGGGVGIGAGDG